MPGKLQRIVFSPEATAEISAKTKIMGNRSTKRQAACNQGA
jgi:hypothetical protein